MLFWLALNLYGISAIALISFGIMQYNTSLDLLFEGWSIDVQSQCVILSNQLLQNGFFENPEDEQALSILKQASEAIEGRIIVVDENFRIIGDTYDIDINKYNISKEVLGCFNEKSNSFIDRSNFYMEYAQPVIITEETETKVVGAILAGASGDSIENWSSGAIPRSKTIFSLWAVGLIPFCLLLARILTVPMRKLAHVLSKTETGTLEEITLNTAYSEVRNICDAYNVTVTRLKRLDDTRQQFVSDVSHELKTPITSIRVLADSLLAQQDVPAELYREFMQDISDEIDRESRIIEDLLSLVRLDKAADELNIGQVNINELLESLLKRLRPLAQVRNIEITYESYRTVSAEADEVKLSLAISNLVENAIKYNKDNGWIKVTLNADHKFFYIKVADSGVGIPEDCQEHVFERFYRVDKARSRDTGGTGLGLAITQSIIHSHHGAIKLYSDPDEGTIFTVRIPLTFIL